MQTSVLRVVKVPELSIMDVRHIVSHDFGECSGDAQVLSGMEKLRLGEAIFTGPHYLPDNSNILI